MSELQERAKEARHEGLDGRECHDHRTVGYRAWCIDCQEWCYPDSPCHGCERPFLVRAIDAWWDWYEGNGNPPASMDATVVPMMKAARRFIRTQVFLGHVISESENP